MIIKLTQTQTPKPKSESFTWKTRVTSTEIRPEPEAAPAEVNPQPVDVQEIETQPQTPNVQPNRKRNLVPLAAGINLLTTPPLTTAPVMTGVGIFILKRGGDHH